MEAAAESDALVPPALAIAGDRDRDGVRIPCPRSPSLETEAHNPSSLGAGNLVRWTTRGWLPDKLILGCKGLCLQAWRWSFGNRPTMLRHAGVRRCYELSPRCYRNSLMVFR
jgi:hypothetical protein